METPSKVIQLEEARRSEEEEEDERRRGGGGEGTADIFYATILHQK